MKKVPIRVRHNGDWSWRVSGDMGPNRTVSGFAWSRLYHDSWLFLNLAKTKQPLVIESGKKNKKFWRKVYRRIARLAS